MEENLRTSQLPLTTNTNMMPELLADSNKLVDENGRKYFEKAEIPPEKDDINDYIDDVKIDNEYEPYDNKSYDNKPYEDTQSKTVEVDDDDAHLSKEKLQLRKFDILRKLAELKMRGIQLSQNYNINSDYKTMKFEYDMRKGLQQKQNGVDMACGLFLHTIYFVENLNEKYDPFGIKLKGWTNFVNSDLSVYQEIFGELYDKWFKSGKGLGPEIRLLYHISIGVLSLHLNNKYGEGFSSFKTENPDLVEKMRKKAVEDTSKVPFKKEEEHINNLMKDYETLKEKELERLNYERKIAELKKQIDKSTEQPVIQPPPVPYEVQKQFFTDVQSSRSSKSSKSSSISLRSKDTRSTISVNPDLKRIIENTNKEKEIMSIENISKDDVTNAKISLGGLEKVPKRKIGVGRKRKTTKNK